MTMPKADPAAKALFETLLPEDPRVHSKPMFGNVAGFVNGNMFMGVFGEELFVRLSEEDRTELLAQKGASPFEPMAGRVMKEYVVLPYDWRSDERARRWVKRSFAWASGLAVKEPGQQQRSLESGRRPG